MNSSLDALLYQWVGEADESRVESAFRAYYAAAFPSLVRHVQYRTGWDLAAAEDIAQEALLRFFERTSRGRREAGALVRTELMRLRTLQAGVLDSSRVARWAGDVDALRESVVNFRLPSRGMPADGDWRAAAGDLSARITPLQRTGWGLLDEARRRLEWLLGGKDASEVEPPEVSAGSAGQDAAAADLDESEIATFVRGLVQRLAPHDASAVAVEERFPGVGQSMESVLTVVEALPSLRVPTNGFLFEIATSTLLDEIKRRRRRKRGGGQDRTAEHEGPECRAPDMGAHPIEALPDDPHAEPDGAWLDRDPVPGPQWHAATGMLPLTIDPVMRYETEELFERFYEYLRRPVSRALRALERARARGRALPEERRLECVSRKFSRTMTVLALMGEGYTQEEAARRVGLSRNQVKYIVESVKEAYIRFAAGEPFEPDRQANREGESHVS